MILSEACMEMQAITRGERWGEGRLPLFREGG